MSAPPSKHQKNNDEKKYETKSAPPRETQTTDQPSSIAQPPVTQQTDAASTLAPSVQPPQNSTQTPNQNQGKTDSEDELKVRDETRANYWEKLDNMFYGTIKHAETAFRINITLNIVVAAVGLVVLGYSIGYSWIHGLDLYTTAFGSLGVASFIALFYFAPQKKIQKTMGDLAQLQMLYRTYFMEAEEVNDLCYRHNPKTIEELEKINKHLTEITSTVCEKIETYVGEKGE